MSIIRRRTRKKYKHIEGTDYLQAKEEGKEMKAALQFPLIINRHVKDQVVLPFYSSATKNKN